MGCFDRSFDLNLVDAFAGCVQGFSRSEAVVSSTCRYDTVLLLPCVRQSLIVVAVRCFDRSFYLNLVDGFAGCVQGFSRSGSCRFVDLQV